MKRYHEWLEGTVIGPPKAIGACTVDELREMGLVGVYAQVELPDDA